MLPVIIFLVQVFDGDEKFSQYITSDFINFQFINENPSLFGWKAEGEKEAFNLEISTKDLSQSGRDYVNKINSIGDKNLEGYSIHAMYKKTLVHELSGFNFALVNNGLFMIDKNKLESEHKKVIESKRPYWAYRMITEK